MGKYTLLGVGFKVCIYDIDHPGPHCHVIFSNEELTVVNLPELTIKHGNPLSKQVRAFLLDNLDTLCDEFDNRHPKK